MPIKTIGNFYKFLVLFLFIYSSPLFALPCPNGQGIMYKGDSIEEVLRQCGEPYEKNTKVLITSTMQVWVYNKPLPYNSGYANLIITILNNRVSTIRVNTHTWGWLCNQNVIQSGELITTQLSCGDTSYNLQTTNLCGGIISLGDNSEVVLSQCGAPHSQTMETNRVEQTELTYEPTKPTTIIFQNGKLYDWR